MEKSEIMKFQIRWTDLGVQINNLRQNVNFWITSDVVNIWELFHHTNSHFNTNEQQTQLQTEKKLIKSDKTRHAKIRQAKKIDWKILM